MESLGMSAVDDITVMIVAFYVVSINWVSQKSLIYSLTYDSAS